MVPATLISMPPRHGSDNRYGARLPMRAPSMDGECWRCAEPGEFQLTERRAHRRRLFRVGLVIAGQTRGSVDLCDPCLRTMVPLTPDSLDVQMASGLSRSHRGDSTLGHRTPPRNATRSMNDLGVAGKLVGEGAVRTETAAMSGADLARSREASGS